MTTDDVRGEGMRDDLGWEDEEGFELGLTWPWLIFLLFLLGILVLYARGFAGTVRIMRLFSKK